VSTPADISVVIPVFNRSDIIRYTLESVRRASAGFNVETIDSWRRLPRDFSPEFSARQLAIWRRLAPAGPLERPGERYFRGLAPARPHERRTDHAPYPKWTLRGLSDDERQRISSAPRCSPAAVSPPYQPWRRAAQRLSLGRTVYQLWHRPLGACARYYQEQALVALMLAGHDAQCLPSRDYLLLPDEAECRRPTAALHHYVDLSKRGYFRHAWRHVWSP
jgi:hypothetical protein